jgi:hypothetical protein
MRKADAVATELTRSELLWKAADALRGQVDWGVKEVSGQILNLI